MSQNHLEISNFQLYILCFRKGVAAALMSRVIQEADNRKVSNIYAYVREDNKVKKMLIMNKTKVSTRSDKLN